MRKTIGTVSTNLIEGGILVIAVLLLLLGNVRGGLIVAAAIPLSMLFAFTGMVEAGLSGNLMSLGAIDFGLIVDGSVVMIENIVRRLGEARAPGTIEGRRDPRRGARGGPAGVLRRADHHHRLPADPDAGRRGGEDVPPDGAHRRVRADRLAGARADAHAGAGVARLQGDGVRARAAADSLAEGPVPSVAAPARWPGRCSRAASPPPCSWPSLGLVPFMGAEFIPKLDEGAVALQAWRLPSVSLTESVKSTTLIERTLKQFPEVVTVVSRTGQAEIPTDPMGVETSDIYVILKDHGEWTTASTKEALVAAFNEALEREVPGNVLSYSQPIELRVQELIAGVRSDLAITLFGEDLDELRRIGADITRVVSGVRGAADVKLEQTSGLPFLRVKIRRDEIARYGINASQVLDVVQAMGGRAVGEVLEGQRRFDIQVRFTAGVTQRHREDPDAEGRRPPGPHDSAVAARRHRRRRGTGADHPREHPSANRRGGERPRHRPRQFRRGRAAGRRQSGDAADRATTWSTAASSRTCSGRRSGCCSWCRWRCS